MTGATYFDENGDAKPAFKNTVLYKAAKGEYLNGFARDMSDGKVSIYRAV